MSRPSENNPSVTNFLSKPLSFNYAKHRIRLADSDCHIQVVKDDRSISPLDPIIGYYMYNLDQERQSMLRVHRPCGRENEPVKRLYDIQLRRVTPENRLHDPTLFAFF